MPRPLGGGIKQFFVWRLSVAYIGNNSRTERPKKIKIGTQVTHVTQDSETTFKVRRSKVKVTWGGGILWRPPTLAPTACCIQNGLVAVNSHCLPSESKSIKSFVSR